jgi:hypothetical protein
MYWGIVASLLLHAALLVIFSQREPAPVAPSRSLLPELTLFLLPVPQARPAPARVERPEQPRQQLAQRNSHPTTAGMRKRAEAPPVPAQSPENTITETEVKELPTPAESRPRLDLDAALKMAGKIAKDPNGMRDDRAVAQLKNHPLTAINPDSRLAQDIQRGAREDCLQSQSAKGLLAPIFLVADAVLSKKDGGCKW